MATFVWYITLAPLERILEKRRRLVRRKNRRGLRCLDDFLIQLVPAVHLLRFFLNHSQIILEEVSRTLTSLVIERRLRVNVQQDLLARLLFHFLISNLLENVKIEALAR